MYDHHVVEVLERDVELGEQPAELDHLLEVLVNGSLVEDAVGDVAEYVVERLVDLHLLLLLLLQLVLDR